MATHDAEMRAAPNNKAQKAALGVAELLERILLQLEPSDVMRCLRVSRMFNETILASPSLRQKLYLDIDPTEKTVNPLLEKHIFAFRPPGVEPLLLLDSKIGRLWKITISACAQPTGHPVLHFRMWTRDHCPIPTTWLKPGGLLPKMHVVHGTNSMAICVLHQYGTESTCSVASNGTLQELMDEVVKLSGLKRNVYHA